MFDSFDPLSIVEGQGNRNMLNLFRCQEEDWLIREYFVRSLKFKKACFHRYTVNRL